jgi:poly-gamma-glutamate biosynthesis protein PgsC/CapC
MSEVDLLYIGIGLTVSLIYSELFGVAPGGIIVPGYLALGMGDPVSLVLTLGVSLLTFFVVRVLATVMIVYGRRRTALMILIGFVIGSLVRADLGVGMLIDPFEIQVIGYIVPGLIAIWIDRQGLTVTVSASLAASVVTRLSALLVLGA